MNVMITVWQSVCSAKLICLPEKGKKNKAVREQTLSEWVHFRGNNSACFILLISTLNPLYIGGLFHGFMLSKYICHFRGIGSILSLLFYF